MMNFMFGDQGLTSGRLQQIDELCREFSGCHTIGPDSSVMDYGIVLKDGNTTSLRIQLPPHFPRDRPQLSVTRPVISPIVDQTGRVRKERLATLDQWVYPGSKLVEVVREATALLVGSPSQAAPSNLTPPGGGFPQRNAQPPPRPSMYGPMQTAMGMSSALPPPPPPPAGGGVQSRPGSAHGLPPPPPGLSVPTGWDTVSPEMVAQSVEPELERYTAQQLEELLTDSDKFKEFAMRIMLNTPAAQAVEDLKGKVMEAAQENLERSNEMQEARNQLNIVRSSDYAVARSQYDELSSRQERVWAALAPERFRSRLENAVSKADHDSDELRHQFEAGSLVPEDFVERFVTARTDYYTLDMKRQFAEYELGVLPGGR